MTKLIETIVHITNMGGIIQFSQANDKLQIQVAKETNPENFDCAYIDQENLSEGRVVFETLTAFNGLD